MIHSRAIQCIVFFVLFLIPQHANASTKVWSEYFDNYSCTSGQTCPVAQTSSGGWAGIVWAGRPEPNREAIYNTDYTYASPGRTGTGKYLKGTANKAICWGWKPNGTWSSNEFYMSFYQKFDNYVVENSGHENYKIWRPAFYGTDGARRDIEVVLTKSNELVVVYYSPGPNGTTIIRDGSKYIPLKQSQTDGNWRRYEFYINFAYGIFRIWYEGVFIYTNENTYPGGDSGWGITNSVYAIGVGNIDGSPAGFPNGGTFTRSYDDVEVWDGMPSINKSYISPNLLSSPRTPINLKVN